jgi:hypothetical protein
MFASINSRIAAALAAFSFLTSSLVATPFLNAQPEESAFHHSLEGAWWVTVTQYNCATGAKRPPFSSMLLFSRGGTLTETTSNPGFLPGQRSIGIGTWAREEHGTYSASDVAYIQFTGNGFTQGTQKLTHSITLDRDADSFTDEATVQFNDATGALILSGCASASATRLQ